MYVLAKVPDILYAVISIKTTKEFDSWYSSRTVRDRVLIDNRLERIRNSRHFGDMKSLGNGLAELRWRNGYRVYFGRLRESLVLLLVGGQKNAQEKDIQKARVLLQRHAYLGTEEFK